MPTVAMWGKALTVMPRVTKQDWDGLDIVSRWLIATRSAVTIMTFTSAAFAGLLAAKVGEFDWLLWGAFQVGTYVDSPDGTQPNARELDQVVPAVDGHDDRHSERFKRGPFERTHHSSAL